MNVGVPVWYQKATLEKSSSRSFQLMLSYIVALVVYFLLHRSLVALMRIFAERKATR